MRPQSEPQDRSYPDLRGNSSIHRAGFRALNEKRQQISRVRRFIVGMIVILTLGHIMLLFNLTKYLAGLL